MNEQINIYIIGTGRMGHGHARTFAAMDVDAVLPAVRVLQSAWDAWQGRH